MIWDQVPSWSEGIYPIGTLLTINRRAGVNAFSVKSSSQYGTDSYNIARANFPDLARRAKSTRIKVLASKYY
jgi:hypothetical protein